MSSESVREGSWADVLAEGRLPRVILVCLANWISASDALVTATVMPSVGSDLGGYAYFGWATAAFLLGSVVAGASAGLLSLRFGVRRAMALAALICAIGCACSAAAGQMGIFLMGRLLQGVGGGALAGCSAAAVGLLFPNRTLPRIYAAATAVWGVASLLGPLIGGVFADLHAWRGVFWMFASQAIAVSIAALVLLPRSDAGEPARRIAWLQLALIAIGIGAVGVADLSRQISVSVALTVVGVLVLLGMVWVDRRMATRLLPRGVQSLSTVPGVGLATMFLLCASGMGFSVFGPALLQKLAGYSALAAGYIVAGEAVLWTVVGLAVAQLTGRWPTRMIRAGAFCVAVGVGLCALAFPRASGPAILVAGAIQGGGFGACWAFMCQRILASVDDEDRALAASAMSTTQFTGAAVGAAAAAAVANLEGFADGLTTEAAQAAGFWVFVFLAPMALAGALGAVRMTADQTAR